MPPIRLYEGELKWNVSCDKEVDREGWWVFISPLNGHARVTATTSQCLPVPVAASSTANEYRKDDKASGSQSAVQRVQAVKPKNQLILIRPICDRRLRGEHRMVIPRLHNAAGCQTGFSQPV